MPTLNLFLPPLLGGFIFVSSFYLTRYWIAREQGYKLVFAASIAGGVFWLLAHVLWEAQRAKIWAVPIDSWWNSSIGIDHSFASASAFAAGALLWIPLNFASRAPWSYSAGRFASRLIRGRGDAFEVFPLTALEDQLTVAITLRSGKVYVGRVVSLPTAKAAPESIQVFLLRSGYREPGTHKLHLTVNYEGGAHGKKVEQLGAQLSDEIREELAKHPRWRRGKRARAEKRLGRKVRARLDRTANLVFNLTVFTREIVSVAYFDLKLFEEHFSIDDPLPEESRRPLSVAPRGDGVVSISEDTTAVT